jgi:hypothetical protein
MGDFNEQVGIDPNGMASVLAVGGLIDSHVTHHGIENDPSTYAWGHTHVDYIFMSERLRPHLLRAGIEPFNQRIFSNHRGLFIDLSLPGLFDRSLTTLASPCNRHLCATNQKHVKNYIRELYSYFQQHLVLQRLEELKTRPTMNPQKVSTETSPELCFMQNSSASPSTVFPGLMTSMPP